MTTARRCSSCSFQKRCIILQAVTERTGMKPDAFACRLYWAEGVEEPEGSHVLEIVAPKEKPRCGMCGGSGFTISGFTGGVSACICQIPGVWVPPPDTHELSVIGLSRQVASLASALEGLSVLPDDGTSHCWCNRKGIVGHTAACKAAKLAFALAMEEQA